MFRLLLRMQDVQGLHVVEAHLDVCSSTLFPVCGINFCVKVGLGLGGWLSWESACLSCMKSWVPPPALRKPGMGGAHNLGILVQVIPMQHVKRANCACSISTVDLTDTTWHDTCET